MSLIYSRGYRAYLACQARYGDGNKFICHGNHPCPLSLSLGGKLRLGSNADTLTYFESETVSSEESPPVVAQFLDGDKQCMKLIAIMCFAL